MSTVHESPAIVSSVQAKHCLNILKLSDRQLSDLRQAITDEARRRAQLAVNGHDPAAVIWGNEAAKRAITVAAAGKHSILFVGPRHCGKTMCRALCLELGIQETYEARHCPCGNYGDPLAPCTCTTRQIGRVVAKFPVTDITVEVCRPSTHEFNPHGARHSQISQMRDAVNRMSPYTDASLVGDSENFLRAAVRELGFDMAAVASIQQVARTIANLDNSRQIQPQHISEAINYRSFCR